MLTRLRLHARRFWLLWRIGDTEARMDSAWLDGSLDAETQRTWEASIKADQAEVDRIEDALYGEDES